MLKQFTFRSKLFIAFGCLAAVILVVVVLAYLTILQYKQATKLMLDVNHLGRAITLERIGITQFLSGDKTGVETYLDGHGEIDDIRTNIKSLGSSKYRQNIVRITSRENFIHTQFINQEADFFERLDTAKIEFIKKNNKHIARLGGYRDAWVEPRSGKNERVNHIFDNIRRERILVEDFDARSADRSLVREEFRNTNDKVVADLVDLLQQEIEDGLKRSSSDELTAKLQILKNVSGKITAKTFPAISKEEASILGIAAHDDILFGPDADNATQALNDSCSEAVDEYEEAGGTSLWPRANITKVGENVTPIFTLGKIISCQQGLRVNAETIFQLHIDYIDEIEPNILAMLDDSAKYHSEISESMIQLADRTGLFLFIVALLTTIFGFAIPLFAFRNTLGLIQKIRKRRDK